MSDNSIAGSSKSEVASRVIKFGNMSVQHRRFTQNPDYKKFQEDRLKNLLGFITNWNEDRGNGEFQIGNPETMNNSYLLLLKFSRESSRADFIKILSNTFPEVQIKTQKNASYSVFDHSRELTLYLEMGFQDPEPSAFYYLFMSIICLLLLLFLLNILETILPVQYSWLPSFLTLDRLFAVFVH